MTTGENTPITFGQAMADAQNKHGLGNFVEARPVWAQAKMLAPDDNGYARAERGDAQSAMCLGEIIDARQIADNAYAIHDQIVRSSDGGDLVGPLRERAQSGNVLGGIVLFSATTAELHATNTIGIYSHGEESARILESSFNDLVQICDVENDPDQHLINGIGRLSMAATLYGDDLNKARDYSRLAFRLGWKSESKELSTSSDDLSWEARKSAVGRAVIRGVAARTVYSLAAGNSDSQSWARRTGLKITRWAI